MKNLLRRSVGSALAFLALAAAVTPAAPSLTTLVAFDGTNGATPRAPLLQVASGAFYGTTSSGGAGSVGTVFRLTPSGAFTNVISFHGTNGAGPRAGLVLTPAGALYGTAYYGGLSNAGTVYRVTPDDTFATVVSLANPTGGYPIAGLLFGPDGDLYGTAALGGSNSAGAVIRVTTNGVLTQVFSFGFGGSTGDSPYGNLVSGSDGSLYGTAFQGGANGQGTLFRLLTNGALTTLYSFGGPNDGAKPYAGPVWGTDGSLYGTTSFGGTQGVGTIYKLTTNGTYTSLFSFAITNGAYPQAALLPGADGALYGTTYAGGVYTNASGDGYGTIFKLSTNGVLTTLHSFNHTNGASPAAPLVLGADGDFYGTTENGGANDQGSVFRLRLTAPPPVFEQVTATVDSLALTWSAVPGEMYQIQFRTNLNQPDWLDLGNAVTATNSTATLLDSVGPDLQRFYRAVLLP
jgi:uncharacterized repeat protein (TIGR03803 family)